MKFGLQVWRFISSVRFSLILIALSALFTAWGSFIESRFHSHLAAQSVYEHPLFQLLLAGFFVNIFASALNRWPFRVSHTGFLITHLGLLMILAGQILKSHLGLQGWVLLQEGTSQHHLNDSQRYELVYEGQTKQVFPLRAKAGHILKQTLVAGDPSEPLEIKITNIRRAVKERLHYWFHGQKLSLHQPLCDPRLLHARQLVTTKRTSYSKNLDFQFFLDSLELQVETQTYSWSKASEGIPTAYGLLIPMPIMDDIQPWPIAIAWYKKNTLAATNQEAPGLSDFTKDTPVAIYYLQNRPQDTTWYFPQEPLRVTPSFKWQIHSPPTLWSWIDEADVEHLTWIDSHGRWQDQCFSSLSVQEVIVFNGGRQGYGASCYFKDYKPLNGYTLASTVIHQLSPNSLTLSEDSLAQLYELWIQDCPHLLSLKKYPQAPDAWGMPLQDLPLDWQVALWITRELYFKLQYSMDNPDAIIQILKKQHWPMADALVNALPAQETDPRVRALWLFRGLLDQVSLLAPLMQTAYLQELANVSSSDMPDPLEARCLWLMLQGAHPAFLQLEMRQTQTTHIQAISEISREFINLEDSNDPDRELTCLTCHLSLGKQQQIVDIPIDRFNAGLPWPVFNGAGLLQVRHRIEPLPYPMRLFRAHPLFYPGTQQAQEYIAELALVDRLTNSPTSYGQLSMNRVLELPSGHRFYLSSISPMQPVQARKAILAVNYDPTKNVLTYPGALLLSLGSIILLVRQRAYVRELFQFRQHH